MNICQIKSKNVENVILFLGWRCYDLIKSIFFYILLIIFGKLSWKDIQVFPERSCGYRKMPPFSCNGSFVRWVFLDLFSHKKSLIQHFQYILVKCRFRVPTEKRFHYKKKWFFFGTILSRPFWRASHIKQFFR